MPQGFVSTLKRNSLEVAKLEGAQAGEFLTLLRDLQDTLRGRFSALGGQENTLDVSRLRQIIAETDAGIRVLETKAGKNFRGAQDDAAELSIDHIVSEVAKLSGAFDAKPSHVSINAAKVLADPTQGLLANHFDSSVKRYGLDVLNDVRRRLFVGLRAGDRLSDVIKDVAGERSALGRVGRDNATRLVRTEVSQAYGAAHHASAVQAAKEVPALEKVWLHIGSYPCPVCIPLHGTMRPMDGTWTIKQGRKTREVSGPPGHPNCACRLSTMTKKWQQGLKKAGYLTADPKTLAKPKPEEPSASKDPGIFFKNNDRHYDIATGDAYYASEAANGRYSLVSVAADSLTPSQPGVGRAQVADIKDAIRSGKSMPPIKVLEMDNGKRVIIDGHHRYEAHRQLGIKILSKIVKARSQ